VSSSQTSAQRSGVAGSAATAGSGADSAPSTGRLPRGRAAGRGIPDATVARLPIYLRALGALSDEGVSTVSSEALAAAAGVNSAKLRKDLSYLGSYGTRGVGYDVDYLVYQISRELGLTQDWAVVIVGLGHLGHALANYGGFASRGFAIKALVDADPDIVGTEIAGLTVAPLDALEQVVGDFEVAIGVIATPAQVAQEVCDRLVGAGVSSILNFAPSVLVVPDEVEVRKVDMSIELQILAFHEQRKLPSAATSGARDERRRSAAEDVVTSTAAAVPGLARVVNK
jgi:redox-sensing transcriptional repressor